MHEYYRENREKWFSYPRTNTPEQQREYYKANREAFYVRNHNREARIKGNGGVLPTNVHATLFDAQEGCCYLCGELLYRRFDDPVSLEHLIPVSRGGRNDPSNVVLAHLSCNKKKFTNILNR